MMAHVIWLVCCLWWMKIEVIDGLEPLCFNGTCYTHHGTVLPPHTSWTCLPPMADSAAANSEMKFLFRAAGWWMQHYRVCQSLYNPSVANTSGWRWHDGHDTSQYSNWNMIPNWKSNMVLLSGDNWHGITSTTPCGLACITATGQPQPTCSGNSCRFKKKIVSFTTSYIPPDHHTSLQAASTLRCASLCLLHQCRRFFFDANTKTCMMQTLYSGIVGVPWSPMEDWTAYEHF